MKAPRPRAALESRELRLLALALLAGATLLALEVIWFRFLLLSLFGTSATFAAMLAAVLVGIALGGLLAAKLLAALHSARALMPDASRWKGQSRAEASEWEWLAERLTPSP